MKGLPLAARVYVWAVIGVGAVAARRVLPGTLHRESVALRAAARPLVDHVGVQGEPAAGAAVVDDVGLVRGRFRVAAAARPERDDGRRGVERVQPVHVPDQGAQPDSPHALQHGVPRRHRAGGGAVYHWLGGVPGPMSTASITRSSRSSAPRRPTSSINTIAMATAIALSTRQPLIKVWNENFLWSAPSYFVGAGAAALATWLSLGSRDSGSRRSRPPRCILTYRTLQGLSRARRRRAAARPGDGGPAPGDDRSAGARDRREGSDVAARTSAACSSTPPRWRAASA